MRSVPQDYHLHSRFSPDSQTEMETVCRRAVEMGIGEICSTDHVDFLPEDVAYNYLRPASYHCGEQTNTGELWLSQNC